jgi:hypothetical protein
MILYRVTLLHWFLFWYDAEIRNAWYIQRVDSETKQLQSKNEGDTARKPWTDYAASESTYFNRSDFARAEGISATYKTS